MKEEPLGIPVLTGESYPKMDYLMAILSTGISTTTSSIAGASGPGLLQYKH